MSLLGISHALFGIILLSSKEDKNKSDFLLIIWILILLQPFINEFITILKGTQWTSAGFNNQALTLLNGPMLYLYIRELIKKENSPQIMHWPHFIPFAFFYLILFNNPIPLQPGGPGQDTGQVNFILKQFGLINVAVFLIYGILSLLLLFRHSKELKEIFAYKNRKNTLVWIAFLPVIFIVFVTIIIIVENSSWGKQVEILNLHLSLFLFFTLYLVFFGLQQQRIYPVGKQRIIEDEQKNDNTSEQQKKSHSEAEIQELYLIEKIKETMSTTKLYQNASLSVFDLADSMNLSRHKISSLLNDKLSMNFFQFVNQYRLEEVSQRLKKDSENKYNILELAYESGFNSKSSFNSLFKKEYGLTPSQYKKSIHNQKII